MDRLKSLIANHPEALYTSSRARIPGLENNWLKIIEGENALLSSVWICRFTTRIISISPGDQSCSYGHRLHKLECQIVRKQRKIAYSDTQDKQHISDIANDIVPDNDAATDAYGESDEPQIHDVGSSSNSVEASSLDTQDKQHISDIADDIVPDNDDATDAYGESDEPQIHNVGSSSNSVEAYHNMQSIGSSLLATAANTTTSFNDIDESITQNVNGFDGEIAAEVSLATSDHADPIPVIQVRITMIDMASHLYYFLWSP
jgi:hypothetical protein